MAGLFYLCYKSYQYNYDFYNIFGTMMFLCCAKNIEIKKIVKLDLYIRIVRSVLFLTLPFMGLMINKINVWIAGRTRTFFGWTHANMMGLDFLLLAMVFNFTISVLSARSMERKRLRRIRWSFGAHAHCFF